MAFELAVVTGELFYTNTDGDVVQVQSGDIIPDNAQLFSQNGTANFVTTDGEVAYLEATSPARSASLLLKENDVAEDEFIVYDESLAALDEQLENATLSPDQDNLATDDRALSSTEPRIENVNQRENPENIGNSFVRIVRIAEDIGAPQFSYETRPPVRPDADFNSNGMEAGSGTITLLPLGELNDANPVIIGQSDLNAGSPIIITVTDSQGEETVTRTRVQEDGSFSVQLGPFDDGILELVVTAPLPNGDVVEITDTLIIDTVPPTLSIDALSASDSDTPVITGETDLPPGSEITMVVTDAGGNVQTVVGIVAEDGRFSLIADTPLAEGDYTVEVSATDTAGNTSIHTDTGTIDLTAPVLIVNEISTDSDDSQVISGTVDLPEGGIVTITITDRLGDSQTVITEVQNDGSFSVTVPDDLPAGDYTADITATDDAGQSNHHHRLRHPSYIRRHANGNPL